MTDRDRGGERPLEETPEVAAAVDDDSTVPQLRAGGVDPDNPTFTEPDGAVPDTGSPNLIGDPYAAGTGATGTGTGAAPDGTRAKKASTRVAMRGPKTASPRATPSRARRTSSPSSSFSR